MSEPRDPINDAIVALLDRVNARHAATIDAMRAEVKQRGTTWAAEEICRLRRELRISRARLLHHA